jgi:hypothetical protein
MAVGTVDIRVVWGNYDNKSLQKNQESENRAPLFLPMSLDIPHS